MRLRDIEDVFARAIPRLTFKSNPAGQNVQISGFRGAVEASTEIKAAGVLSEEADALLNVTELVSHVSDIVVVKPETHTVFNNAVSTLRVRASALRDAIRSVLSPEAADEIAIKLPDDEDLDKVAGILSNVNKLLSQVIVNDHVGGRIKLKSFDLGSNWIEILLGSALAVIVVGRMCRLIVERRTKNADVARTEELLRSLYLSEETVTAAVREISAKLDVWQEQQIREIAALAGAGGDANEYRERLKHSVKMLDGLVDNGMEIHASRSVGAEAAAAFPTGGVLRAPAGQLPEGARKLGEGTS